MIDPLLEEKMDRIAESIFGTSHDPDQIPATHESAEKLEKLTSYWIKYKLDEQGDPISWVVVVPTTRSIAEKFLQKEITEKQILDLTLPQKHYSAIYLCVAITVPAYRRQGLAIELLKEAIEDIPKTKDFILFAWPYSEEGEKLIKTSGLEVRLRI